MKKENAIRKLLGINQHDLALLLQVSRSQVAMYESGKRRLPLKAMEKLSKLLLFSPLPQESFLVVLHFKILKNTNSI